MRRRSLSGEELHKVIRLRQAGVSWLKIQSETAIDRRTAKRTYEDWERNQSMEELKAARKDVAAEEFRNHLHYLVTLAETLTQTLDVPRSPNLMTHAADVLSKMWQLDSLRNCSMYGVGDLGESVEARRLLLASLKTHTSAKVRWGALDEWEEAWERCAPALQELKHETCKVMDNIIEQKALMQKLKKGSKKKDVTERMANGVLHTVWEQILRPSDQFPVVQIAPRADGQSDVLYGTDKFVVGIILDGIDLAKQIEEACKWGAKNVFLSSQAEAVASIIRTIRERIGELQRSLNPLVLGPLIISTRCNLCPA